MKKELFGKLPNGDAVHIYTIGNKDATVKVIDYGAAIQSFTAFGTSIVGGFDTLDGYLSDDSHQGATIGRVANRISGASFKMNGKVYNLPKNNGQNCLHGGRGFDYKMWSVCEYSDASISLEYTSADMEEGFPSELYVRVTFSLIGSELMIDYVAKPKGDTPIALTNHSYFNLNGFGGTILEHTAEIFADRYTEVDSSLIPNGLRPEVFGTAFDFTTPHKIGERIGGDFIGYDHNFILSPKEYKTFGNRELGLCARISGERLSLSVYTDQPGLQFYIGNVLGEGADFAGGIKQVRHGAFCLETQTEPDCVNHGVGFYSASDTYRHRTVYSVALK